MCHFGTASGHSCAQAILIDYSQGGACQSPDGRNVRLGHRVGTAGARRTLVTTRNHNGAVIATECEPSGDYWLITHMADR